MYEMNNPIPWPKHTAKTIRKKKRGSDDLWLIRVEVGSGAKTFRNWVGQKVLPMSWRAFLVEKRCPRLCACMLDTHSNEDCVNGALVFLFWAGWLAESGYANPCLPENCVNGPLFFLSAG